MAAESVPGIQTWPPTVPALSLWAWNPAAAPPKCALTLPKTQHPAGQGQAHQDWLESCSRARAQQDRTGQRVPLAGTAVTDTLKDRGSLPGQLAPTGHNNNNRRSQEAAEGAGEMHTLHTREELLGTERRGQVLPGSGIFKTHVVFKGISLLLLQEELGLHSRSLGESHQEPGPGRLGLRGGNNLPDLPTRGHFLPFSSVQLAESTGDRQTGRAVSLQSRGSA